MSLILRIYLHTNSLERNNESSFLACCHADAAINPFNLPKPEILPIYSYSPYKDTLCDRERSENKLDLPLQLERAVRPSARRRGIWTVRHLSMPKHVPPPGRPAS